MTRIDYSAAQTETQLINNTVATTLLLSTKKALCHAM